jgi:hypothetical protein
VIPSQVDFLLFQVEAPKNQAAELAQVFSKFCTDSVLNLRFHRAASSTVNAHIYLYAKLPNPMAIEVEACRALQAALETVAGHLSRESRVRVSRLQLALLPHSVSHREIPKFHYVVETDTDEGWFDEIARWYDEEHMLGLAAVPGCISAMRLVNLDAKQEADDNRPLSFACYDLTSPDVLVSPPWLAVRHTAWSDIARPHFTNTLRTMMDVLEVDV